MKSRAKIKYMHAIILFSLLIIVIACYAMMHKINKHMARENCDMVLDQLEGVIAENDDSIETMMRIAEDEYLIRASMLVDVINEDAASAKTVDYYRELAKRVDIDEINVFDNTGTIVGGTNPEYMGYNLDSGEQMGFFKPMLSDHSLGMCQKPTPNTVEGKVMMYAMVWDNDNDRLIQVGITPDRILFRLQECDIANIIKRMPVIKGMTIFAIDTESRCVVGSTDKKLLNTELLKDSGLDEDISSNERYTTSAVISGKKQYVTYEEYDKYYLGVSYSYNAAKSKSKWYMLILLCILFINYFIICRTTGHYFMALKDNEKELLKAKEDAERANAAKTGFLSRMSHDIRTPLNAIMGLIEISEMHSYDAELVRANREKSKIAARHLLDLLNDVLEYNKMGSDDVKLAHEPFNVNELSNDVLIITKQRATENRVSLIHDNCEGGIEYPYVYGSPLHIRQIFINIIGNAIKYNHPGGYVKCSMKCEKHTDDKVWFTIVVSDNGIGMGEEFQKHIFEPFTQESHDARSIYNGNGLGLSIVKQLIDKMGGTIDLKSKKGAGTTFTIAIPLDEAKESDIKAVKMVEDASDLNGVNILLVEDNELNMDIAEMLLKGVGAKITKAYNGLQALQIYESNPDNTFDIILMDIMMPIMDGHEATRKIRCSKKKDAKTIPVVAMTANAFTEDIEKSKMAGMNAHLAKPLNLKEIISVTLQNIKEDK